MVKMRKITVRIERDLLDSVREPGKTWSQTVSEGLKLIIEDYRQRQARAKPKNA